MIVLDSSFIVKIVVEEEDSRVARKLFREWIRRGEVIATVDIALSETLNALWKHYILIKDLDLDSFRNALKDLLSLWNGFTVIPTHEIAEKSLDVAVKEKVTIYDSLYLALAQQYSACLATFDTRQRIVANKLGIGTCVSPF